MADEEVYGQPCADAKIVLLGASGGGKSAIALKYVRNEFIEKNAPATVGACFFAKRIIVGSNVVKLQIWDTAGQDRFHSLTPLYYRGAVGAILVFDLMNPASFKEVESWAEELSQNSGGETALVVVGNKRDLFYANGSEPAQPHVPKAARTYAESINAMYIETSAKDGTGINELFSELTKTIIERKLIKIPEPGDAPVKPEPSGGGGLKLDSTVVDPEPEQPKRRRC